MVRITAGNCTCCDLDIGIVGVVLRDSLLLNRCELRGCGRIDMGVMVLVISRVTVLLLVLGRDWWCKAAMLHDRCVLVLLRSMRSVHLDRNGLFDGSGRNGSGVAAGSELGLTLKEILNSG